MTKKYVHACCVACWDELYKEEKGAASTMAAPYIFIEHCCFCGERTDSGIYIRDREAAPEFCLHDKESSNDETW